jgi:hypothetical protein
MIRSFGLVAVLAAFSAAAAQDVQKPTLKVMSFHVTKPDGPVAKADARADGRGPGFDRDRGTRVVVRVEVPGRQLLNIDTKASKVESFTDDKNTDLTVAPAGGPPTKLLEVERGAIRTRPSELTFHAPACPAGGATKVRIKGSLIVVVGKDEKDVEKKDFAGDADLGFGTVTEQKGGFGGGTVAYEGDKPLKSVSVTDADGKTVACTLSAGNPFGKAAKQSAYRYTIRPNERGTTLRGTLRVKYFDGTEEITIPVDLEVGPGF